jgi:hypothetical protein
MGAGALQDLDARRADMDADGIAVDRNMASGDDGGPYHSLALASVGGHIWNARLADFISGAPERHLGVSQIPRWDIDGAVRESEWARNAGLNAVNLSAPRADYPSYSAHLRAFMVCVRGR